MTLVEIVVALTILSGTLLGMGKFVTAFQRAGTQADSRSVAADFAVARLEELKAATSYAAISAMAGTESPIGAGGDSAKFSRTTYVKQVGGSAVSDIHDYKIVTVVVAPLSGAVAPVRKTTVITAF